MPKGCSPSRARGGRWRRRGKRSRRAPGVKAGAPARESRAAASVDDAAGAQALPECVLVRVGDAVLGAHGERGLDDHLQVPEDAVAVDAGAQVGPDENAVLVAERAGAVIAEQFDTFGAVHWPFLWGGVSI